MNEDCTNCEKIQLIFSSIFFIICTENYQLVFTEVSCENIKLRTLNKKFQFVVVSSIALAVENCNETIEEGSEVNTINIVLKYAYACPF